MTRACPLFLLAAALAFPQEAEIRAVVTQYGDALRLGRDAEPFLAPNFRFVNPYGHLFERPLPGDRSLPKLKSRSDFLTAVHLLTPDTALAAGLWHDPSARPPFDSGLSDATLVRHAGHWKIASWRDGYLPSPASLVRAQPGPPLTREWEPLFDGKSAAGWVAVNGLPGVPPTWKIEDGALVTTPAGPQMSIRTIRQFTTFELEWEWQAAPGANSGVKYRLYAARVSPDGDVADAVGFEYQLADDDRDPGARLDPRQRTGALYSIVAPDHAAKPNPPGEWNRSSIRLGPSAVEHFLNGRRTARFPIDQIFLSPISLQHHTSQVRFRRIRIRAFLGE